MKQYRDLALAVLAFTLAMAAEGLQAASERIINALDD